MGAGVLSLPLGVDPPVHRLAADAVPPAGTPGRPDAAVTPSPAGAQDGWALDLPDRVPLVAVYWRMNLTMRQLGPLFGTSHSAVHRVIDALGPLLALAPVRRRPKGPGHNRREHRAQACRPGPGTVAEPYPGRAGRPS